MMGLGVGRALNLSVWPSPVGTQGDFAVELKMRVDTFALFFQLMFEFVAFLAIVASRGFIHADEPHQGEDYALMLLAAVGMMFTALVLLIAGFGFKVAVVPFHMWAPDVYQGSPTTISVLLTSASKNVGIVALFRVFLIGLLSVQVDWVATLAILAIVTQTVGNVVAIPQRSIKRMLAYSSIAQAGYILIALAVGAIALQSTPPHTDNAAYVASFGLVGGMLHVFVYGAMKTG